MQRKTAQDFDQELLILFDAYVHGVIDRRGVLAGAQRLRCHAWVPCASGGAAQHGGLILRAQPLKERAGFLPPGGVAARQFQYRPVAAPQHPLWPKRVQHVLAPALDRADHRARASFGHQSGQLAKRARLNRNPLQPIRPRLPLVGGNVGLGAMVNHNLQSWIAIAKGQKMRQMPRLDQRVKNESAACHCLQGRGQRALQRPRRVGQVVQLGPQSLQLGVGAASGSRPRDRRASQNAPGMAWAIMATLSCHSSTVCAPDITISMAGWASGNCSAAARNGT